MKLLIKQLVTVIGLASGFATVSQAASYTWNGGSTPSPKWSIKQNWNGTDLVAATNSDLYFGGVIRLTDNTNDFAVNSNFRNITFNSGAGAFTLKGNGIILNGGITNSSVNAQTINLNMALTAGTHYFNTAAGNITLGGAISGAGGALTKTGANTLILTGTNTYSGPTTISAGTLQVGNGGTTGTLGGGNITNNATLSFNRSNAMTVNNIISGSGLMNISGTGALTLNALNTYTNITTVLNGKLVVNGSLQSPVTVKSGATLGGTGVVHQIVTMDVGSLLCPAESVGTIIFENALILLTGATNIMEIVSGSLYDVIKGSATNMLTMNGTTVFDFTGSTTVTNGARFAVLQNWGSMSLTGAVFKTVGLSDDLSLDSSELASTGFVTVIPEPAAIGLIGIGALVSLLINRLHKRTSYR